MINNPPHEKSPVILHLATDFPDGICTTATQAIPNLLEEAADHFVHRIVSFNRLKKLYWKLDASDPELIRLQFFSPPKGIFSNLMLLLMSFWLFFRLRNTQVDLIHAHKLTTDGPLGYFLSLWMSCPLVLSVRGDTDSRFVRYKPFSHWLFRRILRKAQHIFWVSGWARKPLLERLMSESEASRILAKSSLLPNIVKVNPVSQPDGAHSPEQPRFLFVGKLSQAEKKGLWRVFQALSVLEYVQLDIYGQGTDEEIATLQRQIDHHALRERVFYRGVLSQQQLSARMPGYTALVMPSRDETFGMVYVEALLNGLPAIGCQHSGIDGYLSDDKQYMISVDIDNPDALVQAMTTIAQQHDVLVDQLAQDIQKGTLDIFHTDRIAAHYRTVLLSLHLGESLQDSIGL